jgi:hypothetical protein
MSLHKRKDFERIAGINSAFLTTYIKRGKIIVNEDGYIDDSVRENAEFLYSRIGESTEKHAVITEPVKKTQASQVVLKADYRSKFDLETSKKALDIEKTAEEIEILKIKKQKLQGEVIPTELVKVIFKQHSASITTSFKNGIENLILELSKSKNMTRTEVAEIRFRMTDIINDAVTESIGMSKKMIKNIIAEYSEKKDVGEREV